MFETRMYVQPSMDAVLASSLQDTLGLQGVDEEHLSKAAKYHNASIMNVQRLWEASFQKPSYLPAQGTSDPLRRICPSCILCMCIA